MRMITAMTTSFCVAALCTVGASTLISACSSTSAAEPALVATTEMAAAECTMQALGDSGVGGTITFTAAGNDDSGDTGVKIVANITGLAPNSEHGFHIHEKGDCSSADGKSAGGHFNPAGVDHGTPAGPSHIGDLGNLVADENGHATLELVKVGATLGSGTTDVLGRGVIIHANADDLTSQPTGAAGGRIACGVIAAQ